MAGCQNSRHGGVQFVKLCARDVRRPINHDRLRAMRPAMRRGRDEGLRPQHCFCIQVTYAPAMRPAQAEPAAILAQPHGY